MTLTYYHLTHNKIPSFKILHMTVLIIEAHNKSPSELPKEIYSSLLPFLFHDTDSTKNPIIWLTSSDEPIPSVILLFL